MKRISIFRQRLKTPKSINRKTKKTISITGVSSKLGTTHLCLCIANYLHSAMKHPVLYIELNSSSCLLPMVGEHLYKLGDMTCYKYKGVIYALSCDSSTALQLINSFDGDVVVDISKLSSDNALVFNQCQKQLVIGSMKPWCKKDLFLFINNMKGKINITSITYLIKGRIDARELKKEYPYQSVSLPIIYDPFCLAEDDFNSLYYILE